MKSLGETNAGTHFAITQNRWHLPGAAIVSAQELDGTELLKKHCGTCHAADGLIRQTWKSSFKRLPPDFVSGPFVYAPPGLPSDLRS